MFNSLKYAKILEKVGFTREQAETHIQIMTEIVETSLATKQDLKDLTVHMESRFNEVNHSIKELTISMDHKIRESEYRMTIKLGTIVSIAMGVAVGLMKLI